MKAGIYVVVVAMLLIVVSMNIHADSPNLVPEETDITFQGDGGVGTIVYQACLPVNASDIVYINWTQGSVAAGQQFMVWFYTGYFPYKYMNMTIEGNNLWFRAQNGDSSPANAWFKSSNYGCIRVLITTWQWLPQQTINISVDRYQSPTTNLTEIYNLIDGLSQTMNNINQTLNQLVQQSDNLTNNITDIYNQIDILQSRIDDNTINISNLRDNITSIKQDIDNLKIKVENINVTSNTNITNVIIANLTELNNTMNDLSEIFNKLNSTVNNIPDNTDEVATLRTENANLKTEVETLKKQVDDINISGINKTIYTNNTIEKTVQEGLPIGTASLVLGSIILALIGIAIGVAAYSKTRKREPPIEHIEKEIADDPISSVEPEDDVIPMAKTVKRDKETEENMDSDTWRDDKVWKALEEPVSITIGEKEYSESEIMSNLSSLPRGLPAEFFGKDPSDLASELMAQKYVENHEGDIVFQYHKKWYYGDPSRLGTYMQRAPKPDN